MTPNQKSLSAVIREVRACFNRLKSLSEELHLDLGINPSMRAVMEALSIRSPQTVPDIARSRSVSRQHVQTIMNSLLDEALVESDLNPAHRRSVLYRLTQKGRATFDEIRRREAEPLQRMAASFSIDELEAVRATLRAVNGTIDAELHNNAGASGAEHA